MDPEGEARSFAHEPVMVAEVVELLRPALSRAGLVVDCTLGGGGHSEAILEAFPAASILGLDRDAQALASAGVRLAAHGSRFRSHKANFSELRELVDGEVAGILYDLGVSSPQLDLAGRGFGYRVDSPLDMRMDRSSPLRAEDVVNNYSQTELKNLIGTFGEERFAGRIASAIVRRRQTEPFRSTGDLAEVVKQAIPAPARRTGPHPARRTFQALRIEVNDELASLQRSLDVAIPLLRAGGRVLVLSYHSLEDRIVKRRFVAAAKGCTCPAELAVCVCGREAEVRVLTKKPLRPGQEEIARNPRSDSARLRAAEKLAVGP